MQPQKLQKFTSCYEVPTGANKNKQLNKKTNNKKPQQMFASKGSLKAQILKGTRLSKNGDFS